MNYLATFLSMNREIRISTYRELELLTLVLGPCIGLRYEGEDLVRDIADTEELDSMMGVESPDYFGDYVDLQYWAWNNTNEDFESTDV